MLRIHNFIVPVLSLSFLNEPNFRGVTIKTNGQISNFLDNILIGYRLLMVIEEIMLDEFHLYLIKDLTSIDPVKLHKGTLTLIVQQVYVGSW